MTTPIPPSPPSSHVHSKTSAEPIGPRTFVLATRNPGKIREFDKLLAPLNARVVGLDALERSGRGPFPEPPETERTFMGNATLKASAYARMTGLPCLSDDSGLEVDALGGLPGVDSAWFAYASEADAKAQPREIRDLANNQLLLSRLAGVPFPERSARFVCQMVLVNPGGEVIASSRGEFEGRIGLPRSEADDPASAVPRGNNGFGYDPLLLVESERFARTSAELSPEEKNERSHRGQAVRGMIRLIEQIKPGS